MRIKKRVFFDKGMFYNASFFLESFGGVVDYTNFNEFCIDVGTYLKDYERIRKLNEWKVVKNGNSESVELMLS